MDKGEGSNNGSNGQENDSEDEGVNIEVVLLKLSRHGSTEELKKLLEQHQEIDINCTGQTKPNKSWSSLHLASYFGHVDTVVVLLQHKADPNITNNTGDTPLHKASLTSRVEVVKTLVKHGANCSITNNDGKLPSHISNNDEITYYLQASEKVEKYKLSEQFLQFVKEGRLDDLKSLMKCGCGFDMKLADEHGNNALHHAVMRDQLTTAILLLEHGLDPTRPNKEGVTPLEMSKSLQMTKLLDVQPLRRQMKEVQRFEGPLMKKNTDNNYGFSMEYFDGTRHYLMVHQKNNPLHERQKWIEVINEHIGYSNHFVVATRLVESDDSDDEENESTPKENNKPTVDINNILLNANAHHKVLKEHLDDLVPLVHRLLTIQKQSFSAERNRYLNHVVSKCQEIVQTSQELYDGYATCHSSIQHKNKECETRVRQEEERNRILQQAIQALATEHHNLETSLAGRSSSVVAHSTDEEATKQFTSDNLIGAEVDMAQQQRIACSNMYSDDDEFYDALSEDDDDVTMDAQLRRVNGSGDAKDDQEIGGGKSQQTAGTTTTSSNNNHNDSSSSKSSTAASTTSSVTSSSEGGDVGFRHRDSLPVEMFSRDDFSIWHVLRECIGKELSKITMPVIFNEPLSFIQRLVEYMEYSCLIKQASQSENSITRLEYVTTFAISALASQFERLGKPFNPLLGETFEYKREDLGFHWMSEQVSHHPPISAFCALGTDDDHPFEFRGSCDPKIRFWGKTVNIEPRGHVVLDLNRRNESYTWTNPSLSVHNIVVGKMWMEQHGVIEIHNLTTKEKCVVEFKSYSWFTSDLNKIEATCYDANGAKVRVLLGDWTKSLYSLSMDAMKKYQDLLSATHKSDKHLSKAEKKEMNSSSPMQRALLQLEADESCDCRCLWKVRRRPSNSSQMYNMTKFAMSINQPNVDGYEPAPTDSRKRPDIRMLEDGDIDAASTEKGRLEEKQRAARKVRTKRKQEWTPRWFEKTKHPQTKGDDWQLQGDKFHKRSWSDCPDIF